MGIEGTVLTMKKPIRWPNTSDLTLLCPTDDYAGRTAAISRSIRFFRILPSEILRNPVWLEQRTEIESESRRTYCDQTIYHLPTGRGYHARPLKESKLVAEVEGTIEEIEFGNFHNPAVLTVKTRRGSYPVRLWPSFHVPHPIIVGKIRSFSLGDVCRVEEHKVFYTVEDIPQSIEKIRTITNVDTGYAYAHSQFL